jgi:hypothetical protein
VTRAGAHQRGHSQCHVEHVDDRSGMGGHGPITYILHWKVAFAVAISCFLSVNEGRSFYYEYSIKSFQIKHSFISFSKILKPIIFYLKTSLPLKKKKVLVEKKEVHE